MLQKTITISHLTVESDARAVALLGQIARPDRDRFLQRQRVAVRGVQERDPFAFRDVGLVLRDLGVPARDVPPDVRVFCEAGQGQVAGALAATGEARVRQCLSRQKSRSGDGS